MQLLNRTLLSNNTINIILKQKLTGDLLQVVLVYGAFLAWTSLLKVISSLFLLMVSLIEITELRVAVPGV